MNEQTTNQGFKVNMYPVMYWALAYGAICGVALFVVFLLSRFITVVWFPVFLAGLVWGGYRNYQRQKADWQQNSGIRQTPQTPMNEFKQAVSDVVDASREMMAQEAVTTQPEAVVSEEPTEEEQEISQEELPPEPPQTPASIL